MKRAYIAATRSAPRVVSLLVDRDTDIAQFKVLQPPLRVRLANGREAIALTIAADPADFRCMGADDFERLLNRQPQPTGGNK